MNIQHNTLHSVDKNSVTRIRDDFLNTAMAADFLGISERTLKRDRKKTKPEFPCIRIGKLYGYSKGALREWWKKKNTE